MSNAVILYQGPRAFGTPNMSPFCIKVEMYLRMANIPYTVKGWNPARAPKGKMPVLGHDGKLIGDSSFIIEYLKRTFGDSVDSHLTAEQHALGRAVQRMLEEASYFVGLYARWMEDDSWPLVRDAIFKRLPLMVRLLMPRKVRRRMRRILDMQGTGRHSRDEIYELGKRDLSAVAALLGDKPYLLGDKPSSYDAVVFAFLIANLRAPADNPLKQHTQGLKNVTAYVDRLNTQYFADLNQRRAS